MSWNTTFHPDGDRDDAKSLRAAFLAQRKEFAIQSINDCERINRAGQRTLVGNQLIDLLEGDIEASSAVFDDPVFAAWLRFLIRAASQGRHQEALRHAVNMPNILARVAKRLTGGENIYVPASTIAVQRDDLDPYIMAATPPTYDFMSQDFKSGAMSGIGHPLELQAELLGITLKTIGDVWPEMKDDVLDYVKIVGYLPDATFRSCSAARYSGVVYLGNMDESLLDIEESIVHETGHQILYRLAELTPLTTAEATMDLDYILPWSGSRRDLLGFLHAYYIYVLLVKYFARRAALGDHTKDDCERRAGLILLGIDIARPSLEGAMHLSEQGRMIVTALGRDIDELHEMVKVPSHERVT